ncbi:putative lipase protein [Botrytis fragariae]|uniref:sn-1-specific diacylglycerol lipase n=1 Tax=Botrytis fragariae TaxID=1964551 RepID=A0A8H6EIC3_9HELO|nr:putative lipase protein [Botrytis fragariae]KAF5873332.1 putative lipase protein [Botrytis fragariae]
MSLKELEPQVLEALDAELQYQAEEIVGIEDNAVTYHKRLPQIIRESTLLPSPIATAVSLVTRSSSLYIRLGTFIGGLAIDGARVTTLTGLEVSRAIIEGILHRAGKDVANRSTGELGKLEAEGLLERSIANLHATITGISFAASTSFHFSSVALSSATDISQQLLGTLDSILGSTDSSRAIASIITLIRREFQNPATGVEGEKVGVGDLLLGICGLALLQRWCRKLTDLECRENKHEEVLWDVVVLDDGRRADVVGMISGDSPNIQRDPTKLSFMNTRGGELLETIEREESSRADDGEDKVESVLRQRLIKSLPSDASVSITTSTITTTIKTITVEVSGFEPPVFLPPPGVEILEEHAIRLENADLIRGGKQPEITPVPRYRVVYGIVGNRLRNTSVAEQELLQAIEKNVESDNSLGDDQDCDAPGSVAYSNIPKATYIDDGSPIQEGYSPVDPRRRTTGNKSKMPRLSLPGVLDEKCIVIAEMSSLVSDNLANQKRSRKPISPTSSDDSSKQIFLKPISNNQISKKSKTDETTVERQDKKNSFRQALKGRSSTKLSNLFNKDEGKEDSKPKLPPRPRPTWGDPTHASIVRSTSAHLSIPQKRSRSTAGSSTPVRGNQAPLTSENLDKIQPDLPRTPSRTSYYTVHEQRKDSMVSQTDTYSIHSFDQGRPHSPVTPKNRYMGQNNAMRFRSERGMTLENPLLTPKSHRRTHSNEESIFTLNTNNSEICLIPNFGREKGIFEGGEALDSLMRTGKIDGTFPKRHIIQNITRFVKFASASYGSNFLRVMGISDPSTRQELNAIHHFEHQSFSSHTQLPADTILLSSFVDPQGGTDSSGLTNTGVPMVHYVSLDHQSQAIVLTCRGTLGFEDVLADMTCDYDELVWRGKAYKVHKGIHASARRLLHGGGGRVMATIKAALEEFPDYGLVMCGHSLGGGVSTLLAIMVSEPAGYGTSFVTSYNPENLSTSLGATDNSSQILHLPPGRPIHVYAYGPPATVSPSLRSATRGLITTVVNGNDLVPHLSLGLLHDLQAVALAFKNDNSGAKGEVKRRVWTGMSNSFTERWYGRSGHGTDEEEEDKWHMLHLKRSELELFTAKLAVQRMHKPITPRTANRTINNGQEARSYHRAHPYWLKTARQYINKVPLDEIKQEWFGINNPPLHDASQSEDCLFLDVMVPTTIFEKTSKIETCDDEPSAPVLVWIDGGGFTCGYKHATNPAGLIENSVVLKEEFVYVSINYRLGLYGFLGGPLLKADGDANAVTVMGESAGGGSILHQITAYGRMRGPPPFQQAILQSPGFQPNPGSYQQERILNYVLKDASSFSNRSITTIDDLRTVDTRTLAKVNYFIVANSPYGLHTFGPTVDGSFVSALPGQVLADKNFHTSLELMIWGIDQEGVLFTSPYILNQVDCVADLKWLFPRTPELLIYDVFALYPDQLDGKYGYTSEMMRAAFTSAESCFACNTRYLNVKVGNKTYVYSFNVPPALHADDVAYTFYNGPGSVTWDGNPVFEGAALSLKITL